jgi:hypothetical protein
METFGKHFKSRERGRQRKQRSRGKDIKREKIIQRGKEIKGDSGDFGLKEGQIVSMCSALVLCPPLLPFKILLLNSSWPSAWPNCP